jgi:predicted NAD/FAD-binding protein
LEGIVRGKGTGFTGNYPLSSSDGLRYSGSVLDMLRFPRSTSFSLLRGYGGKDVLFGRTKWNIVKKPSRYLT